MSDPLDQSQQLAVPLKRTRGQAAMDELAVRVKEIGRKVVRFTLIVMAANAALYIALLLWFHLDVDKTNKAYTNSFQFQCVSWICMYMYGYFMRVEAKQDVALAMGHDSVDLMAKMDDAIEKRAERFDRLMTRFESLLEQSEKGEGALAGRFETIFRDEMEKLRAEIRNERGNADAEIAKALEEGEAGIGTPGGAQAGEP